MPGNQLAEKGIKSLKTFIWTRPEASLKNQKQSPNSYSRTYVKRVSLGPSSFSRKICQNKICSNCTGESHSGREVALTKVAEARSFGSTCCPLSPLCRRAGSQNEEQETKMSFYPIANWILVS